MRNEAKGMDDVPGLPGFAPNFAQMVLYLVSDQVAFHSRFHPPRTSFVKAKIQFIVSINYDRGVSWLWFNRNSRYCAGSEDDDDEHASGSSSNDDDVLGHAANWG